ncbi:MAG: hypothetical protein AAF607_03905 [Pseudomonadota bacterium]
MAKTPWFKFYPTDWRSDPALKMCSLAARGLWIEMLMIMHEADPRGQLLVKGKALTDAQLAVLAGTTPDQIPDLLGELESAEVFSRTLKGVIYSRRMTKDEKKAKIARKNGKSGGNPKLCNKSENRASVNPQDKVMDNGSLKTQKPEARDQILEKQKKPSKKKLGDKPRTPCPFEPGDKPPDEYLKLIDDRGYCRVWANSEFLKFVGHADSKSLEYDSWRGAWATWVGNAERYAARDGRAIPKAAEQKSGGGRYGAAFWDKASENQQKRASELFWTRWDWDKDWGPMPDEPGCKMPDDVIAHGYERSGRGKWPGRRMELTG